MRALFVTPQFERDVLKVPQEIQTRANPVIQKLRLNPFESSLDVKKLKGIRPTTYRVRIGQYRLAFSFSKTSIILHRFRHRKDIYR